MDNLRGFTEIVQMKSGNKRLATDIVIIERTLTIIANGIKVVSLACLDDKLVELGFGYLFSEMIVTRLDDVTEYELDTSTLTLRLTLNKTDNELKKCLTDRAKISGCGGGIIREVNSDESSSLSKEGVLDNDKKDFPPFPIQLESVPELLKNFQLESELFQSTGGVHGAALIDNQEGEIRAYADDVGRHNAIDKVIGSAVLNRWNLAEYSILTTGRVSFEIIGKAVAMNIPLLISRSAPTSKAISIAKKSGIYLIGFARGDRFNIYTGLSHFDATSKIGD